jgi:RNA polymerase sigma factor (sigma-70 family)
MDRFRYEDEERLRRRCVEGDPDAWEALCSRYYLLVASIVRNILAKRGLPSRQNDVEEGVAEFFGDLCATRRVTLGAFRGDGAFRAFLAVLAANHSRRHAEAERRRRGRFGPAIDGGAADEPFAVEDEDVRRDDSEEVDLLLSSLTEAEQSLFRVLFVEEMDPEDAAARLGITRSALYIRKCRLLKRVRALLDERSEEPATSPGHGKRERSHGHHETR